MIGGFLGVAETTTGLEDTGLEAGFAETIDGLEETTAGLGAGGFLDGALDSLGGGALFVTTTGFLGDMSTGTDLGAIDFLGGAELCLGGAGFGREALAVIGLPMGMSFTRCPLVVVTVSFGNSAVKFS